MIANVSAHREPNASPISGEPENSRLRELKDAIDSGELDAEINGPEPNVKTTVTCKDFELYVAATNKNYWREFLQRWQKVQNSSTVQSSNEFKGKRVSLLNFLEVASTYGWNVVDPDGHDGFDLIHGIGEAAGLGDLTILGRPASPSIPSTIKLEKLRRIPTQYWETMDIDPMSCFIFTNPGIVIGLKKDNIATRTRFIRIGATGHQDYADLHIETEGLLEWLDNDADAYRGHYESI